MPMLIGFGCSVPAIMSTRTLSSERDRKMTILLTPFMSCSAKLPILFADYKRIFPKAVSGACNGGTIHIRHYLCHYFML